MNTDEKIPTPEQPKVPHYPECIDLLSETEQKDIDTSLFLIHNKKFHLAHLQLTALAVKYISSPYMIASILILQSNIGKVQKAEELAEKTYESHKNNPMFLCGFGRVLLGQKRLEPLAAVLALVAEHIQTVNGPEKTEFTNQERVELLVVLSEFYFLRIAMLLEANYPDAAFEVWRTAREMMPHHPAITRFDYLFEAKLASLPAQETMPAGQTAEVTAEAVL